LESGIRIALLIALPVAIENGSETMGSTQRLKASVIFRLAADLQRRPAPRV
jgi:hypothetical protein